MENTLGNQADQSQNGNLSQIETTIPKLGHDSQIETVSQIGTGGDVAGAGYLELVQLKKTPIAYSKALHAKAERFICIKYEGLNLWGLEFTAALACYLVLSGREGVGVSVQDVVEWTGARPRWKKRMEEGAREAEAAGCIERIRSGVFGGREGYVMDVTAKGRRVLADYDKRMEELQEDFEARRAINVLKMATRRLSLERRRGDGEARRSLEGGGVGS